MRHINYIFYVYGLFVMVTILFAGSILNLTFSVMALVFYFLILISILVIFSLVLKISPAVDQSLVFPSLHTSRSSFFCLYYCRLCSSILLPTKRRRLMNTV